MLRSLGSILVKTFRDFSEDYCGTMAAALAYYSLFAMPAMLLVAIDVAGAMLGREAAAGQVQIQLSSLLGPQTASAIQTMIRGALSKSHGEGLSGMLAFGGLAFSTVTAVYELQISLNRAWDVELSQFRTRRFFLKRIGSFLLIVGLTILLVISLAAIPLLSRFKGSLSGLERGLFYAGEVLVSWGIFTVLVTAILTIMPDAEIDWRDVWLGAALTSALLVAGKFIISVYLAHAGFSAYGAVGSIAILLLWAYYSAFILLLGAEFTQVWARAHGEQVEPEAGAVRVGRKERVSARQPSPV